MIYVAIILILIVCALLVLAILIQNPKGGGLGAGFGSVGNQVMGARRANDFIEKTTWSLVAALLILCLFSGMAIKKSVNAAEPDSAVNEKLKQSSGVPAPTTVPTQAAPAANQPAAPATTGKP